MSPVPLPVANSTTTELAATRQASCTTTKTANSNTSYRQMAQTTHNNNSSIEAITSTAAAPGAVSANKSKGITMAETKMQHHHPITKEISANSTSLPMANANNTTATTATVNITTSQCDSSSGSSTTSSSSNNCSDINSINVKSETCDAEIKTELESSDNGSEAAAPADANDLQLAAMKHRPILLSSMNAHIICGLCFGYLIDATTIVECLHSFCHSCLIKHLRTEQYCPRCEMMINTAKPNIKPDTTLQAIVYKLVPGLYEKELMRKRAFYKDRPEEAALATPEQRGDDTEHLIFSPSDYMSISLEYADIDELTKSNSEYNELLKPRYLQCPAMCTVTHLKKFVYGKFEINSSRFTIDIMYKVKTIILLDHYTLMDVAYIYTWKRDAPMRFYFRVKQSLKPAIKVKKQFASLPKKEVASPLEATPELHSQAMCIVHEPSPLTTTTESKILEPGEIKQENEAEVSSTTGIPSPPMEKPTQFEIVQPQSPSISSQDATPTEKLKITIVNKAAKDKSNHTDVKTPAPVKALKEKKESHKTSPSTSLTPKDERKVENIKLKIDLSKQNSVTIINMSDPERKEIVKPVRPEKEWKVTKTKKDKDSSPKSSPKSSPHSERKSKTPSPLTVPPITIKAERISPLAKLSSPSTPASSTTSTDSPDDEQKSQFLKSFSLAPIKDIKTDNKETSRLLSKEVTLSVVPRTTSKDLSSSSSKRKSKEPVKAVVKKPKLSPPLATEDFKIKLPPISGGSLKASSTPTNVSSATNTNKKELMPPPAPLAVMKPPSALLKKPGKMQQSKVSAAPPGSLTPHPMHGGIQLAPPGSRTPIAKRYQPILPKASRPNPFANIPSDVNKILKDAGTEIKSIPSEPVATKVYGPKTDGSSSMGPPAMVAPSGKTTGANSSNSRSNSASSKSSSSKNNSYLNLALYNASKSKGNEVPPGCRTPMYTPNSPIYSPSSPQYVPNYNIPTVPTYKYTPKPSNSNSYLQSVLSSNNQMSNLFPTPPVKKDTNSNSLAVSAASNVSNNRNEQTQAPKRVYPFARSPSPGEDPPEKQLKVKSLLNSCNINIPSSLSITITREDGDASSNGSAYPKHKSPVNNYIEILKLPEQTADSSESKRSPPPASNSLFPNPPVKRVATPPLNTPKQVNNSKLSNNLQNSAMMNAPLPPTGNVKAAANNNVCVPNQQLMAKSNGINKPPVVNNKASAPPSNNKPTQGAINDKKTPSPEKRMPSQPVEQKSPKSPDGSACKKFRHILPRQITNPLPEVNVPKPNGNVIGTYSSPNGVNVKIHSNKKVQPSKKSPSMPQKPLQQPAGSNVKNPQQSPTAHAQQSGNNKPASKSSQASKGTKANPSLSAPVNVANKMNNNPSPAAHMQTLSSVMPHPMQAMLPSHLGAAAAACQNAANQAELSKFFKENLFRAQVQAAVANQPNMFYPYAANVAAAAQMGQFNPTMYNYQQAYIMDQLSRMQRAGNDVFTEYMQKLKNSMELQKTQSEGKAPEPLVKQHRNSTSPKAANTHTTSNNSSSSSSSTGSATNTKDQTLGKTK